MANVSTVTNSFIDSIMPVIGFEKQNLNIPTWNESLRMFILNEHESAAGHYYYDGVRISDRIVIVEHIGQFHSFTYLDGMDIYRFDGDGKRLIVQEKYDNKFYDVNFIRERSKQALTNFIKSRATMSGNNPIEDSQAQLMAEQIVANSYQSLLDPDKIKRLELVRSVLTKALHQ